ncbi:Thioredoxin-like protein [Phaffia rhodozyma]|uniref:Thioredoxin-like protein n=1 Tax=Phaffia rhodozyma TaxID=264483 RepID=A0A0F7SGJ4_PHARH|nr:Thioredoxin-like protein [Phaffia rhodozyma]
MTNCQDDLTLTDLLTSSHISSRLTSGSTSSTNLYPYIDTDNVWGLNLEEPSRSTLTAIAGESGSTSLVDRQAGEGRGEAKVVIKSWEDREDDSSWVESGVDDQLILNIPFVQNVRVRSILIKTGRGETAPSVVKIFANRPEGLTFSEIESDLKPTQELALHGEDVVEYPLRVQSFKDVVSIGLFFGEPEGSDKSRVYYIGFLGDPRNPQKDNDTELTIPAALGADAPIGGMKETATPRNATIR